MKPPATPPAADTASAIVGCVDALIGLGVLDPGSGAGAAAPTGLATGELMAGVVQVEYLVRLADS
ncbi:hypothetical protein, partial [Subtercola boreus]|uniref:hypothetical protein n=1 Tax=Subtercola boreus TaxID=120213 RepID=UPI0011C04ECB